MVSSIFTSKSFRYPAVSENGVVKFPEAGAWRFRTWWQRNVCGGFLKNHFMIKRVLKDLNFLGEFMNRVLNLLNKKELFPSCYWRDLRTSSNTREWMATYYF
ncbi:MAG: hypothetical protein L6N95_02910 [Candidatus Methylarchaceae archaeon HK01B]|nr:hypothetical protein [Candidatus Methylarchaceae archaeon HK01B]